MRLVEPGEAWDRELGVEPLSSGFTPEAFIGMLAGRTKSSKAFLLDQRRIAGIGNIYACEALWEARIRPSRPAGALTRAAACRLHESIVNVLRRAITKRGTSVDDYVDAEGLEGGFQNHLTVYGRQGRLCPRCRTSRIVRTVVAQRGTWWCRRCQR
jgi:formamidopyrimidine-DNA glycosylase